MKPLKERLREFFLRSKILNNKTCVKWFLFSDDKLSFLMHSFPDRGDKDFVSKELVILLWRSRHEKSPNLAILDSLLTIKENTELYFQDVDAQWAESEVDLLIKEVESHPDQVAASS